MDQPNKSIENQQSVKISINAKGQYSGEVKVYTPNIDNSYNLALKKAAELEKLIKEKNSLN